MAFLHTYLFVRFMNRFFVNDIHDIGTDYREYDPTDLNGKWRESIIATKLDNRNFECILCGGEKDCDRSGCEQ